MRAFSVSPDDVSVATVDGNVLCNDIVAAGPTGRVRIGKGTVLRGDNVDALRAFSGELHLLSLDSGDVHEDEASLRLARAAAGDGIELRGPIESQTHLRATRRGLFQVRADALTEVNCLPDISVFSIYDGQPVTEGKAVGATKITPLAIPGAILEQAEAILRREEPVMQVLPFLGGSVGVVVRDRLAGSTRGKFEAAIKMKVGWFGSSIAGICYLPDDVGAIRHALEAFVSDGVALILAAGVNSTDPLDLTVQALEGAGGVTEKRGVPAHPGSTCWLASLGGTPIFGLAMCGMFSRTTALDLLLPRFLAGCTVGAADIARFGHGGLLSKDMAFRFPAYTPDA